MAQLLLIKITDTEQKEVDDVIGFFEDSHKFSEDEKFIFTIQQVKGYTREVIVEFARNKQPERKRIYKSKIANVWTLEKPKREIAWKYIDGKWYMLIEEPKYMFTIKNMTEQEKVTIADEKATTLEKLNALAHLECKIDMNSKNLVEIPELNK